MARTSKLGITGSGLLLCLLSTLCWADGNCADEMKATTYSCVYLSCKSKITTFTPGDSNINGQAYTCSSASCCEQLFATCLFVNSECDQIQSAEVRESLNEVSRTSRILLANCRGHYALYVPHVRKVRVQDYGLVDERVLR